MSATPVTTGRASAPVVGAPAPVPARRRSAPSSVRRLRGLQLGAVALILAFGAFAITALALSLTAASHASQSLTQYYRLADAQVQALQVQQSANTWALTPTSAVRQQLDQRLGTLATTLADAAAVSDDRDRVVPLTGALVSYAMTLQDALNAKGTDSAAIAAKADNQLTDDLITPLQAATAHAGDRVATDLTGNWKFWVLGGAVLAGAGLAAIGVALARASHRYLNIGLAAGLLCALVSAGVVWTVAGQAGTAASDFAGTSRAVLDNLTTARQSIHQARADELLSVGLQSAGGTYADRWSTGYNAAKNALADVPKSGTASNALLAYGTGHSTVANAIGKSQWAQAASAAVGSSAKAATSFDDLDTKLTALATSTRQPVTSSVTTLGTGVAGAIAGVIVFTLAGAGLTFWGVSRRIEEYR
ncbi:hypothetical protein [Micropruina glycogenica]|uniref:Uncharacterized protein n=1 Tax=Micropruina glycogenica TaxID=75385 RepID=A0A2N9JFR4_9ACTN|nr:hypothetical protein [Micropruina glycogenica]SPD86254.1 membrane protein of unknown function [Micropruina glycogenica]